MITRRSALHVVAVLLASDRRLSCAKNHANCRELAGFLTTPRLSCEATDA